MISCFRGVRHCEYVGEQEWSCWKELKLSSMMLNHFLWNSKERVLLCSPLNAKIHMSFSVFSDETYGEIETNNYWKKVYCARFYFSTVWPICNQSPHLSAQERSSWVCQETTFFVNCHPNPQSLWELQRICGTRLVYHQKVGMHSWLYVTRHPYLIT